MHFNKDIEEVLGWKLPKLQKYVKFITKYYELMYPSAEKMPKGPKIPSFGHPSMSGKVHAFHFR